MKDIKAVKGKFHIARLIEQGEHECQDFKHSVSDAAKIAHSISAFANNKGGRLLIGVKDNGSIAGVRNEEDIYVVEQAGSMYCRPPQKIEFRAYNADNGAVVIEATIARSEVRPVMAIENDGSRKAYYRVADENIVADRLMVEAWKRMASPDAPAARITDTHRRVLEALDSPEASGGMDARTIARLASLSDAAASAAIIDLTVLGLTDFVHAGNGFSIVLKAADTPE